MDKLNPFSCLVCDTTELHPFAQVSLGKRQQHRLKHYFQCPHCHAVLLDPAEHLTPGQERAHYQTHHNRADDPGYIRLHQTGVEWIAQHCPPQSIGLDYGCGPDSAFAAQLEQRGFQIHRYDPVFFPEQPLEARQYDFIGCLETAEHFHQPKREFSQMSQLLRPGGVLFVQTPMPPPAAQFHHWHQHRDPTHIVFYSLKTFAVIAQANQLVPIKQTQNQVLLQKRQEFCGSKLPGSYFAR